MIFKTYTGNAMLNNALMTIEALAGLQSVSDITPGLLLSFYEKVELKSLNKRLKSYTMLFTKNGPLHNDNANGDKVYDSLFRTIIGSYENEGEKICEVSGLRFSKTFEQVYAEALKKAGFSEKEIRGKDLTLNRSWFPLIGGLGSDAQALPQAKFSVQVHPICVALLQFLPLSSLLYNGGILLIDSSNFDFAKEYIRRNQKLLWEKIQTTPANGSIENVRDLNKGNYILKAIDILEEKEFNEEAYSDLNLWSFSNSGTGASCSIDRVPNDLIRRLITMDKNPKIGEDLKSILSNNKSSSSFLEALEAKNEWWLLYPNKFKDGKKEFEYKGVSVDFLEAYFEVIGEKKKLTEYAKYIAGLIDKYKTKSFEKYLIKSDAWKEADYRMDLYAVLVMAAEKGEWSLQHQIQILDDEDLLPVKNSYYQLHKLIHFYYQKKHYGNELSDPSGIKSAVLAACNWLIMLIEKDINRDRIIAQLINRNEYSVVRYAGLLLRSLENFDIPLEEIAAVLYDVDFRLSVNGLNELLRIYFTAKTREIASLQNTIIAGRALTEEEAEWLGRMKEFAADYQRYYYERYKHIDTGEYPVKKFQTIVSDISLETSKFLQLLKKMIDNTNEFVLNTGGVKNKWKEEDLLYNPLNGEITLSFSKLAIKLLLTKQASISNQKQII